MAEPRCFLHIPKSAGSSVRAALEQALPPGTISPKFHDATLSGGFTEFDRLDPVIRAAFVVHDEEIAALSDYSVVAGHFSLSTLLRVTSPSAVATVLREPRARLLSHYAYWRLLPPAARHAWRPYPGLDHALRPLNEFLTEPLVATATDNVVCRMLLGNDPRIPKLGFIADSDIDSVAQDAIAELDTLGYAAALELGDSMWDGLSGFFGTPLAPVFVNATESHSALAGVPAAQGIVSLDLLDSLDARAAADAILYRHGLSTSGCSAWHAERLQDTAFAAELFRIGNLVGTSATDARTRGRMLEEIAQQRLAKDEEVQRVSMLLRETRQQLATTDEQLKLHRGRLEAIQGSASWRVTAPLRAGKRTFTRLRSSAAPVARRARNEP